MHKISRRNFLYTSSGAIAGTFIAPGLTEADSQSHFSKSALNTGLAKPLPYQSIPGFLSAEQLTPHYKAHYGGALRGYSAADEKLQSSNIKGPALDSSTYGAIQNAITSKGNSVLLHELYFSGMGPVPGNPDLGLRNALEKRFRSVDKWAIDFQASAKAASGWAMLTLHPVNGKLYNVVSNEHATGVLCMNQGVSQLDYCTG